MVYAGAGSGKTRVIVERMAHAIEDGIMANRILAVTFTNKAAAEMKERLSHLHPEGHRVQVGTFHSFCARVLRSFREKPASDFVILDDQDQKSLVKRVLKDLKIEVDAFPIRTFLSQVEQAKRELEWPLHDHTMLNVMQAYDKAMKEANALDFDDLILEGVKIAKSPWLASRFDLILVDEFQDTNRAQFELIKLLGLGHQNVTVVGDDDQSIYGWRGADRRNLMLFKEYFPESAMVKLEQNYRSTQRILRAANAVISKARDREDKHMWTENVEGEPISVMHGWTEREEAELVVSKIAHLCANTCRYSDVAIFYRSHAQARVLEDELLREKIPYKVIGGPRFYERKEIKDILAYARLMIQPKDNVSFMRIVNTPARGIGPQSQEQLYQLAQERGMSYMETAELCLGESEKLRKKWGPFVQLFKDWQPYETERVSERLRRIISDTRYLQMIEQEPLVERESDLQNLAELLSAADDYHLSVDEPSLLGFLEMVSLSARADTESKDGAVTLMTIHASKGLEFPCVMVTGMEEGLLPHRSAAFDQTGDEEDMEEERRLAYVAMTRAQTELHLFWAQTRRIMGSMQAQMRSRFIREMPSQDLDVMQDHSEDTYGGFRGRPSYSSGWSSSKPKAEEPDETSQDTELPYGKGQNVWHSTYGTGVIKRLERGFPPKAWVRFDDETEDRLIVTKFLEQVSD